MNSSKVKIRKRKTQADPFFDSGSEWRRLFSELWGTFLLVLVSVGGGIIAGQTVGQITLGMRIVAPGLIVMVVIYFMGSVSGAHINPAVTLAFAIRGNFEWKRVPGYFVAQFSGGILAAIFLKTVFGEISQEATTSPGPGYNEFQTFLIEVLLTTGLINTILGTASGARNIGPNGAIAVGGYIVVAGLWAHPVSGASMNPVRSFAPDLIRGITDHSWIYLSAPVAGACIATFFEWILKGRPTEEGTKTAEGEGK